MNSDERQAPESIVNRWLYAAAVVGLNNIEDEMTTGFECLAVASKNKEITFKHQEQVVRIIIYNGFLDQELGER